MRKHLYCATSPTANACGFWKEGSRCGQERLAEVHQLDEPRFFSHYPQVQVRVVTGDHGIHFCQVAWDKQPDGWFAAWYEPHNKPRTWVRANKLDAQTSTTIGTWMVSLLGPNDEDDLTDLGLTSD